LENWQSYTYSRTFWTLFLFLVKFFRARDFLRRSRNFIQSSRQLFQRRQAGAKKLLEVAAPIDQPVDNFMAWQVSVPCGVGEVEFLEGFPNQKLPQPLEISG